MSRFPFLSVVASLSVLMGVASAGTAQSPFVNGPVGGGPLVANYGNAGYGNAGYANGGYGYSGYGNPGCAPVITLAPPLIAAPILPPVRVLRPAPIVVAPIWRHRHHRARFHPGRVFVPAPGIVVR